MEVPPAILCRLPSPTHPHPHRPTPHTLPHTFPHPCTRTLPHTFPHTLPHTLLHIFPHTLPHTLPHTFPHTFPPHTFPRTRPLSRRLSRQRNGRHHPPPHQEAMHQLHVRPRAHQRGRQSRTSSSHHLGQRTDAFHHPTMVHSRPSGPNQMCRFARPSVEIIVFLDS